MSHRASVLALFKDDAQERVAAAGAAGYVEAMPAVLVAEMNRVIGTLVRVAV